MLSFLFVLHFAVFSRDESLCSSRPNIEALSNIEINFYVIGT